MKKFLGFIILVGLIVMVVFTIFPHLAGGMKRVEVKIGDTVVEAEVVSTPTAMRQGLSGRTALNEGEGMLFSFPSSGQYGFWMKDMNFSIDIIWVSAEKRVVGVERDISPQTYPGIFRPSEAVKYVLEVPAGFSQRQAIDIGEEVFF